MYASLLTFPGGLFGELDRLQRQLDVATDPGQQPASIRSVAPGSFPAINVGHTPTSVEIQAFAPGVDPAQIEVTLDRGVLTLAGERTIAPASTQTERGSRRFAYSQERSTGRFRRAVALPDDIDASQVSARYTDGVLHVSVARKAAVQPQRITVA